MPIFDDFLWTKRRPRSKRVGPEESRGVHEGVGRAHHLRRMGLPRGRLGHLLDVRPTPKIPINTETLKINLDRDFRRQKPP